jgi:hypothetical protein
MAREKKELEMAQFKTKRIGIQIPKDFDKYLLLITIGIIGSFINKERSPRRSFSIQFLA